MYMPTHLEDIHLISYLKTAISNQITAHLNHLHILCGDFNRDIALTGRQNNNNNTPPQEEDIQWKNFTTTLNLEYIPTNTKSYILKAISKYRQIYKKSPKNINRKVFKHSETSPLNSITDRHNNILTNPEDIAKEIYI
jgi:hypothetical protein